MPRRQPLLAHAIALGCLSCALHSTAAQDISTSLRGLWALNETSGTSAADTSGNSATGTFTGTATRGNAGRFGLSTGFSGGGGTTDRLSLPNTVLNGQTNLTVSFWLKTTSTATQNSIVSAANGSVDNEYYLYITTAGQLQIRYKGVSNAISWDVSGTRDGKWHHFAIVSNYSGGQTTIYVDGISLGTQTLAASSALSVSSGGLFIGQDQDTLGGSFDATQRLIGDFDQLRIYGRALAALDVKHLYSEGGPVIHWKLDETSGTTAADASGIGLNGTVSGTASWIAAKRHNGFDFNGSTKVEATTLAGQPTNFTLACWARIDATDSSGAEGISLGDSVLLRLHSVSAGVPQVQFHIGSGSFSSASATKSYIGLGWHHFAATFDDSANSLRLYVDGVLVGSASPTSSISWSTLGTMTRAGAHGNTSTTWDLDGGVDDVRVYNRALSASEVIELYGLIGHWKLNETSGTAVADSSGIGNNGTAYGTATWIAAARDNGFSANYTNGEDYIEIPNSASLEHATEDSYSFAAWVKPLSKPPGTGSANDAGYRVVGKPGWHNGIVYTEYQQFMIENWLASGPTWTGAGTWSSTYKPGKFYHVVGVVDLQAGTIKIYVNGSLKDTSTFTAGAALRDYGTVPVRIGIANPASGTWGHAAHAVIDDVRFYNRAIDAAEVLELYGLMGYWKFDEGSGTTIADSSGNGNNATVTGGAPTWVSSGIYGAALSFNGTTDEARTNVSFTPPSEGTVSFWYRSNGPTSTQQRIFGLGGDWEARYGADGILYMDICADSINGGFFTTTAVATAGTWRHVAAVYDCDDNTYALYIDGALHKSGTSTLDLTPQAAAALSFGTRTGSTERFSGSIDEFRVYDRKLSASEVYDLFGLMGWYKLDEASGSVATDSTGLLNDGTYSGSPTLGVAANGASSQGTAVAFNGANFVSIDGLFDMSASTSAAAWVRLDGADSLGADVVSLGNSFTLRLGSGSTGATAVYYNGSTWISASASQYVLNTGWHHFAAVLDSGASLKLYIDGVEAATTSTSGGISYGLGTSTTIAKQGNGSASYDLTGRVDDVRIYNRAIKPDEVFQLYRGSRINGLKILKWVESR